MMDDLKETFAGVDLSQRLCLGQGLSVALTEIEKLRKEVEALKARKS
jgi:hypothetical protein